MLTNIVSWNTFGNSVEKISEVSGKLFRNDCSNILLVQEAGNMSEIRGKKKTFGRFNFNTYFLEQTDAKNLRCTTGMFIQDNINWYTVSSENAKTIRPIVYIDIKIYDKNGHIQNNLVVATMHAIAREHLARKEIAAAIDFISGQFDNWILMGDFNCNPEKIERKDNRSEIDEAIKAESDFKMLYPQIPTQRSGGTLDYCICSDSLVNRISFQSGFPNDPDFTSPESDHIPISVVLEY